MKKIMLLTIFAFCIIHANNNQTNDVSPILVNESLVPFTVNIETENFTVPGGIHSGVTARYGENILLIAGRTNGLHGFNNDNNNFPPSQQNSNVFVINLCTKTVKYRSLSDASSGLTQQQIDTLSVTSPQSYQSGNRLYITGGYGVDTSTGNFSTKDTLTAIDVPGLIDWVIHPKCCNTSAAQHIRQISDPIFQVTGGDMYQFGQCPTLLIFGQNFIGFYNGSSNGIYTHQVRRFHIVDDGKSLGVKVLPSSNPDPNFRRRDLNTIPIIKIKSGKKIPGYVVLSGVFTLDTGIWTVPVEITTNGTPSMADSGLNTTFKQGMNNYASPHIELLSKNGDMYSILFGGISFGYFENGIFKTDDGIPFINQVTTIKRRKNGTYTQYLLPTEYPTILSTQSNPGNKLLFGAGGKFIIAPNMPVFGNGVLDLTKIKKRTVIGYIIGGIQSTLPNTNTASDSAASPYIFKVTLTPKCPCK